MLLVDKTMLMLFFLGSAQNDADAFFSRQRATPTRVAHPQSGAPPPSVRDNRRTGRRINGLVWFPFHNLSTRFLRREFRMYGVLNEIYL